MKLLLAATALMLAIPAAAPGQGGSNCAQTSVAMRALTDLGKAKYHGYAGGLYPSSKNAPPSSYARAGLAASKSVTRVDGKIVLLSIGMSNTTQEFSAFKRAADADARKSPALTIVDGAQGGQDAETIKDPAARFWRVVDERLLAANASPPQVQAIWLKEAIARDTSRFPADARRLQTDLRAILSILQGRYPNLKLVYLSSRTYGGYATTGLNPEPVAYDSGFAVKWLVAERIAGKIKGPHLAWGPYLWTNGLKGRKDGLVWACADTRSDGTHPSLSGQQKIAQLLLKFFTSDPTARPWFVTRSG